MMDLSSKVGVGSDAEQPPSPPMWKDSRSFWKAGSFDVPLSGVQPVVQGHLEHARIHPKFLHTNATSHKWAFGAIAELLDNAVDEVCNGATYVKVDKVQLQDKSSALLFQDDGGGMDPEGMRRCMSLGYSTKKGGTSIGQYGNGFKTSTMRLGADVIVFSRKICGSHATQTVGLLSYTYLRKTGQDDIIVPMVDFEMRDGRFVPLVHNSLDDWNNNLRTILSWSPFPAEDDLFLQFENIGPHGTRVVIYNLWLNDDGLLELDFDYDDEDIHLSDEGNTSQRIHKQVAQSHFSYCYRYSLRAYASILYLRKFSNFQIILRGRAVDQLPIAEGLKFKKVVSYRPQLPTNSNNIEVTITVGFLKEAPILKVHGVNIYHKNRLIMPFLSVSGSSSGTGVVGICFSLYPKWLGGSKCDVRANSTNACALPVPSLDKGVVLASGVLEANFIEPAHDKQDFERTSLFLRLEGKLRHMVVEYRKDNLHLIERPVPPIGKPIQESPALALPPNLSSFQNSGYQAGIETSVIGDNVPNRRQDPAEGGASVPTRRQDPVELIQISNNTESDGSNHSIKDKICEENIQLFTRCDTYRQEEAKLKDIVENLERELKEAKRKYSDLALKVQLHKSRMT